MALPIKSFSDFVRELYEDVATVSTGVGMAGLGSDPPGPKSVLGAGMVRRRKDKIHPRSAKKLTEAADDGALTLTIPVFVRSLEIAREVIKSDDDLHVFVEKLMDLDVSGPLTMDDVYKVFSQYKD
jgi:hypothetical protein